MHTVNAPIEPDQLSRHNIIMNQKVSIIIPNRNAESTIGLCLDAAFSSDYPDFEVIVVDDCSSDRSLMVINRYPCKCILLQKHSGASVARNTGVAHSNGEILFFTDADCLLKKDALNIAVSSFLSDCSDIVVGGTYTLIPADYSFFSRFQSAFIHYSESRNNRKPDYLATHAMIIRSGDFRKMGGFNEKFLPIIEDVEFSHSLRSEGYKLVLNSKIQVKHYFGFSILTSLNNAFRKSMYWTIYSIGNNDLLSDSGTASWGLKFNALTFFISLALLIFMLQGEYFFGISVYVLLVANLYLNRGLFRTFAQAGNCMFFLKSSIYYLLIYPIAVGLGGIVGLGRYGFVYLSSRDTV